MKDLSGMAHSFTEWSAVLDFLAGIAPTKDTLAEIHIEREGAKGWKMRINGANVNNRSKPKAASGVALYDLYW